MNSTNFTTVPPPASTGTIAAIAKFLRLLGEAYPIDRKIDPTFKGTHSVTLDDNGMLNASIWVWKQMQWRLYSTWLTAEEDYHRSPEEAVAEIQRVLKPELEKLLPPALPRPVIPASAR